MTSFIYCFTSEDRQELQQKGYKLIKEEIIGDKNAYVFLCDNKLNFTLDKNKFIVTNKINF